MPTAIGGSLPNFMQTQLTKTPEFCWMEWLEQQSDVRPALQAFCKQYHYFSLNQVIAFSRLFSVVGPNDRNSLALLASVLFEELGLGDPKKVHSVLFERFAVACGVDLAELPLKPSHVVSGVRSYVLELHSAFGGASLPRALATYQFLESSAVETYGPLLLLLTRLKFSADVLEFFSLHATVEVEHAAAAQKMVDRAAFSAEAKAEFDDQTALLQRCWQEFWSDIWQAGRAASE